MYSAIAVRCVFYAFLLLLMTACASFPYRTAESGPSVTKVDSEINAQCEQLRTEGIKNFILCAADVVVGKTDSTHQHMGALRAQFILAMSARLGADRFRGPDGSVA